MPESNNTVRQMTFTRKFFYAISKPFAFAFINLIWSTCKVKIVNPENMEAIIKNQQTIIPVYWHQQHLFCGWYMLQQIKQKMDVGFLVSPSVDGEIPAQLISSKGAHVIRGSSNRTGAKALRELFLIIKKDKVSTVITTDGPTGPIYKFKAGAIMLSHMTGAPILPLACAAQNAWYLNSWDKFMIPKPFSKVVIAVGEAVEVLSDKQTKTYSISEIEMEQVLNQLMVLAKQNLSV